MQALSAERDSLLAQVADLTDVSEAGTAAIEQASRARRQSTVRHQEAHEEMDARVASVEQAKATLDAQVAELQGKMSDEKASHGAATAESEARLSSAQGAVKLLEEQTAALQCQVASAEEEKATLKADAAAVAACQSALETSSAEEVKAVSQARRQSTVRHEASLEEQTAKIAAVSSTKAALESEIEQMKVDLAGVLAGKEEESGKASEQLAVLEAGKAAMEVELGVAVSELQAQVCDLQAKLACESEQCVSLRAEADTSIAGRRASTARHDAAAADMTAQLQSVEVSGAQKLKASLGASSSLSSTNADLSQRITDLEKQVKAVSSDRDSLRAEADTSIAEVLEASQGRRASTTRHEIDAAGLAALNAGRALHTSASSFC